MWDNIYDTRMYTVLSSTYQYMPTSTYSLTKTYTQKQIYNNKTNGGKAIHI